MVSEIDENTSSTIESQGGLSEETREQLRDMCKKSLFFLCRAVLGFTDFDEAIHKQVCNELQDPKNSRIIIVMPRTWYKSTVGSIGYPIWRAINDPNVRVLVCQNTFSNAVKKLSSIKQIFDKNALFRWLFPEILPTASCKWSSDVLEVNRTATHPEGTFEAAGTATAVISRHYDVIVEDDTVAPEKDAMGTEMQQPTATEIAKAIGWHNLATPLLTHPRRGQIVIIGTRWGDDDLIGYVIKKFKNYRIITRAVREKDGKPATKEKGGVPAWPGQFDDTVLEEIEAALGPYMFSTLMMNSPMSSTNQTFNRIWFNFFDTIDITDLICCVSLDPAASDKETSGDPDDTAIVATGVNPSDGRIYILDYVAERLNPGETITKLFQFVSLFSPVYCMVESVAYQRTLRYWIEQRQKKLNNYFIIKDVKNARISKNDRIRAMQPFFSNKLVYMRPHMQDLQRQLLGFMTSMMHDDIVDALSFQVPFWNETLSSVRKVKKAKNPFDRLSGDSIMEEINMRTKKNNIYPRDIGLLCDRDSTRLELGVFA